MSDDHRADDSHVTGRAEQRDPSGSSPLAGQSDKASANDGHRTDTSAGEEGKPSDMDYYRISPRSGAMMMLATIGLPAAIIFLIVIVALFVR